MKSNTEYLEAATEKFNSCAYNSKKQKCSLGGYPVLDCTDCSSYKEETQCKSTLRS